MNFISTCLYSIWNSFHSFFPQFYSDSYLQIVHSLIATFSFFFSINLGRSMFIKSLTQFVRNVSAMKLFAPGFPCHITPRNSNTFSFSLSTWKLEAICEKMANSKQKNSDKFAIERCVSGKLMLKVSNGNRSSERERTTNVQIPVTTCLSSLLQ